MNAVSKEGILWAQPEIAGIVGDQLPALMEAEIHDWLSALYWSEGIAVRYALKMQALASEKRKATWARIYRDEVDHQLRIGRWLIDRGMPPLPPNAAVQFAEQTVDSIHAGLPKEELAEKINTSQLFFEEYTSRLLAWRLPHVQDRDLKASLRRILKDETFHIAFGCAEAETASGEKPNLDRLIASQPNLLFPVHLARQHLSAAQLREVRGKIPSITARVFFDEEPKPIETPAILKRWETLPGYHCVACAPTHESGMHLEPKLEASSGDVVDTLSFPSRMQGFNQILHGGFITMALDEMLGYAVILQKGLLPLTKTIEVAFQGPVVTGHPHTVRARVVANEGQVFRCEAEIVDSSGSVRAKAKGNFYVPDQKLGQKLFAELAEHDFVKSMLFGAPDASRPV